MTQPQHPFTDLPEGAVVKNDGENWCIKSGDTNAWVEPHENGKYRATFDCYETWHEGKTPNEAFQAVRKLANDLGVV